MPNSSSICHLTAPNFQLERGVDSPFQLQHCSTSHLKCDFISHEDLECTLFPFWVLLTLALFALLATGPHLLVSSNRPLTALPCDWPWVDCDMLCKLYFLFFDVLRHFGELFIISQNQVLVNLLLLMIGGGCFTNFLIQLLSRGIQVRCWEVGCVRYVR